MSYSKEDVKNNIDENDVYSLLEFFGANPKMLADHIEATTICHNGDSHRLWYYFNSCMFTCFTQCGSFDIIELVQKVKHIDDFNSAIYFLVNFFNLQWKINNVSADIDYSLEDWKIFDRAGQIEEIQEEDSKLHKIQLDAYDDSILKYYPQPRILNWEKEYISHDICNYLNIHYDPISGSVLIPHYDEDNRCVGIRQRTMIKDEEQYGKYRPWRRKKQQYNHALAFNLFGLNLAKENIQKAEVAIVFESEKAVAQYLTYFGLASDLAVAVCGSSLSRYQFETLQRYHAKEIVIAFDKDYKDNDDETNVENFIKKMRRINDKYNAKCNLSFIVDVDGLLDYKDSPTDKGKDVFLKLFRNRCYMR